MKGSVRLFEVPGPALLGNTLGDATTRTTPVYLPPDYDGATARYPVVYFLHGYAGSGPGWLNRSPFSPGVPERIDGLIARAAVPPFIGVFVDGWTSLGGCQWINSDASGRYRDYVVLDIVGWADRTLRTLARASARAVVGKSSGGYGALVMGRFHADVFAHIGSHSGDAYFEYCYLPDFPKVAAALAKAGGVEAWHREFVARARATKMRSDDFPIISTLAMAADYSPSVGAPLNLELPFELRTARLVPETWGRWLANDPVRFIPACREPFGRLATVFLDCGTRDEFNLRWGTRMVAEALADAGAQLFHEEFDDGHTGTSYRYDASLACLVPRLS